MKKSTKFAALFAAVALLVLGAAMTSFAYGWVQDEGVWKWQNKSGDYVSQEWKSSGSNWYWLDENGEMATSQLVEDDDKLYYVDETGAMVTNNWVSMDPEDGDIADVIYYYFQSNGRAYKASTNGDALAWKTINGKKYTFDADGKMLWGWLKEKDPTLQATEDDTNSEVWREPETVFYCGSWDDGARATSEWRQITVYDGDTDKEEDKDYWFWFQASGRKFAAAEDKDYATKKINGKHYSFASDGHMLSEWVSASAAITDASTSTLASNWQYFASPEDGARYTKGWFRVVPDKHLKQGDYDDDAEKWFYAKGQGQLAQSEIKKINGKWYGFDENGRMLDGLRAIQFVVEDGKSIIKVADSGDNTKVDTEAELDALTWNNIDTDGKLKEDKRLIYFSADGVTDGSMKTGAQNVDVDGDSYAFYFNTTGSERGQGFTGKKSKIYYVNGRKVKASNDDKYIVCEVDEEKLYVLERAVELSVLYPDDTKTWGGSTKDKYIGNDEKLNSAATGKYVVVSTSGSVVTSGTKKEGKYDYYLVVKSGELKGIYKER